MGWDEPIRDCPRCGGRGGWVLMPIGSRERYQECSRCEGDGIVRYGDTSDDTDDSLGEPEDSWARMT
jgi:DnaJ-class molecular chaperone